MEPESDEVSGLILVLMDSDENLHSEIVWKHSGSCSDDDTVLHGHWETGSSSIAGCRWRYSSSAAARCDWNRNQDY
jgi:hypothetical protein